MELRQLRYIVALAEERHFTRAAQSASVAQPALSRQIRKLEEELGVPLVTRTTRQVSLTDAGEQFVERARRALAEVDAARSEARAMVDLLAGAVVVGVTATPGPLDISARLAAFHRAHPAVELRLREELSVTLCGLLRADAVDVAFITAVDAASRRGLRMRSIAAEPLVACLPPDHPLAAHAVVPVEALAAERFVGFRRGATIREQVADAAARRRFEPRIAFESDDAMRVRALVSHGLGVAVLPRSDAEAPGPPVAVAALDDAALVHEVFIASREARAPSPAAAVFAAGFEPTGEI